MSFSVLIAMQGFGVLAAGAVAEAIGARAAVAVAGGVGSALAVPLFFAWRRIPQTQVSRYDPRHRHVARRPGASRHERPTRTASIGD